MSVLSEKIKNALYAKLNVSGVTSLATGGVHSQTVPSEKSRPYVVFTRQAPGQVEYGFAYANQLEDDLWMVKAVTDADSSASVSPSAFGEDILQACQTAIGNSLTVTGGTVHWIARFADTPPFSEILGDSEIYHQGFLLRIAGE